jgi:ribosomal protein L21E
MKAAAAKKMSKVMREYKAGTLNSGSKTGPVVKSRKQALAIGLSQAGKKKSSY